MRSCSTHASSGTPFYDVFNQPLRRVQSADRNHDREGPPLHGVLSGASSRRREADIAPARPARSRRTGRFGRDRRITKLHLTHACVVLSLGVSARGGTLGMQQYRFPADHAVVRADPRRASRTVHALHLRVRRTAAAALPRYPAPAMREDLFVVIGEQHQRSSVRATQALGVVIPERGLFTGIFVVAAIWSPVAKRRRAPYHAIPQQIADAIQFVLHLSRTHRQRYVHELIRVGRYNGAHDCYEPETVFKHERRRTRARTRTGGCP